MSKPKSIYPDVWRKAFLSVFKPKPKLTGSEWADKYRFVAPGTTPEPGEWRTSRTPYLREPMDVATDDETEIVVMKCSSQTGKSESLLNILGFYTPGWEIEFWSPVAIASIITVVLYVVGQNLGDASDPRTHM